MSAVGALVVGGGAHESPPADASDLLASVAVLPSSADFAGSPASKSSLRLPAWGSLAVLAVSVVLTASVVLAGASLPLAALSLLSFAAFLAGLLASLSVLLSPGRWLACGCSVRAVSLCLAVWFGGGAAGAGSSSRLANGCRGARSAVRGKCDGPWWPAAALVSDATWCTDGPPETRVIACNAQASRFGYKAV